MRKIREKGSMSYKLFWTDIKGKWMQRRLNRMKDEEGRILKGEDEVLEVLARLWEELGRSSEDDVDQDAEMGDVAGCKLCMCEEVSWVSRVEVVDVLKYFEERDGS